MIDMLLIVLGVVGLLVGTITDFQRREVADWVNFSMIAAGLGIRLIVAVSTQDLWYILVPLIWIGVVWLFGIGMYYAGQWGGGDAKMLMAMSALFGTYPYVHDKIPPIFNFSHNVLFMAHVFVNIAIVGAVYGLIWGIYLGFSKRKVFAKEFTLLVKSHKNILCLFVGFGISFAISNFFVSEMMLKFLFTVFAFLIVIFPIIHIASKSLEACMIRFMSLDELTEGEWIVDEIKYKGKYITGPKELGITNAQIEQLRKYKIAGARVKVGIPFVPVFFFATLITLFFGNLLLYLF